MYTPQGGERVNQLSTPTSPDALELLLKEYRVSWAGLSSPLRQVSRETVFSCRHTPLTEIWPIEEPSHVADACVFQNTPTEPLHSSH